MTVLNLATGLCVHCMGSMKRVLLLLHICMLFLMPLRLNAQEAAAQEAVPEKPVIKEDSSSIDFYIPFYIPDAMSFFRQEYQNSLADAELVNFYLTAFFNAKSDPESEYGGYQDVRLAGSLGALFPIWWSSYTDNSWSLIIHATGVTDDLSGGMHEGNSHTRLLDFFGGGGIRANYGIVSLGFLCGVNAGSTTYYGYKRSYNHSAGNYATDKIETLDKYALFKFMVPISFGLPKQIIFIDKVIANFSFDKQFGLDQLFSELVFTTFRIMTSAVGINVYYKNEGYNLVTNQQLIGGSFTTKYLQFDGGYRFFSNNYEYKDGAYGRLILKIPFGEKGALAFSVARGLTLSRDYYLDQKTTSGMSFGIGVSLFGDIWQTFVEGGAEITVVEHLDYASLIDDWL